MDTSLETAASPRRARPDSNALWTESRLLQTVRGMFSRPEYRPPILPDIAMRVMEMSRTTEPDVGKLVALLERDPMLAGRALKMAQSAFYTTLMPVTSLKQAVIRLGFSTMHQIVMEAAVNLRVFRAQAYLAPMEQVRQHSTAVAHLTQLTCRRTMITPEQGFLAGLLHDLGIGACLIALSDAPTVERPDSLDTLWTTIDAVHEEAGAVVAAAWKLPSEVRDAISLHHQLSRAPAQLTAVVGLAESLANELGFPLSPAPARNALPSASGAPVPDAQSPLVAKQMASTLGISDTLFAELRIEGAAILKKLSWRI